MHASQGQNSSWHQRQCATWLRIVAKGIKAVVDDRNMCFMHNGIDGVHVEVWLEPNTARGAKPNRATIQFPSSLKIAIRLRPVCIIHQIIIIIILMWNYGQASATLPVAHYRLHRRHFVAERINFKLNEMVFVGLSHIEKNQNHFIISGNKFPFSIFPFSSTAIVVFFSITFSIIFII